MTIQKDEIKKRRESIQSQIAELDAIRLQYVRENCAFKIGDRITFGHYRNRKAQITDIRPSWGWTSEYEDVNLIVKWILKDGSLGVQEHEARMWDKPELLP